MNCATYFYGEITMQAQHIKFPTAIPDVHAPGHVLSIDTFTSNVVTTKWVNPSDSAVFTAKTFLISDSSPVYTAPNADAFESLSYKLQNGPFRGLLRDMYSDAGSSLYLTLPVSLFVATTGEEAEMKIGIDTKGYGVNFDGVEGIDFTTICFSANDSGSVLGTSVSMGVPMKRLRSDPAPKTFSIVLNNKGKDGTGLISSYNRSFLVWYTPDEIGH